jgi:hypothetical protein
LVLEGLIACDELERAEEKFSFFVSDGEVSLLCLLLVSRGWDGWAGLGGVFDFFCIQSKGELCMI